jgi:hypothetical protein
VTETSDPPPPVTAGAPGADGEPIIPGASGSSSSGGSSTTAPDEAVDRASCQACRGDWGKHGLSPVESCNCRARDFGKECRDSAECEGECLADTPAEIVTNAGPPRLGFFVGQCSEFRTSFGCHAVLANGFNLGEPVMLDEGSTLRCLD